MRSSSTALAKAASTISAAEMFRARCEAKAMLYAAGEIDLIEAVDELQRSAAESGLVAEHGQDVVQQVMARAFASST